MQLVSAAHALDCPDLSLYETTIRNCIDSTFECIMAIGGTFYRKGTLESINLRLLVIPFLKRVTSLLLLFPDQKKMCVR